MTLLVPLLTALTMAGELPQTLPDVLVVGDYTEKAVKTIESRIQQRSSHEIRAFFTLSKDITQRIEFIEHASNFIKLLDAIRSNDTAKSLLDGIPGAQWLQMSLNKMSELIQNINGIRLHLKAMERTTKRLIERMDQYFHQNRGDPAKLHELLQTILGANETFQNTSRAFADTETLLGAVSIVLQNCNKTVAQTSDIPLLGTLTKPLKDQLDGILQGVQMAKAIFKAGQQSVRRTQLEIDEVQLLLVSAFAHDTYNAAELAQSQGKAGSALLRFYQVRTYWTDTPWAHRADQRITDAIADINAQAAKEKRLREELQTLQTASAQLQKELNERTKEMSQRNAEITSLKAILTGTLIGVFLLIAGFMFFLFRHPRAKPLVVDSPEEDSSVPSS